MTTGVQANISVREPPSANNSYMVAPMTNGYLNNGHPNGQPMTIPQMQYQQLQQPQPVLQYLPQQQQQQQQQQLQPGMQYQQPVPMPINQQPLVMSAVPVPPPPAPAPPPPGLLGQLNNVKLKPTQTRDDVGATLPRENGHVANGHGRYDMVNGDHLEVFQRDVPISAKQPEAMLADELVRTLGRGTSRHEILSGRPTSENRLLLSEVSTAEEVFEWLKDRGFSSRTMSVLQGQTGATIFALTKRQLQDFCGKDEGQRIYSQLLVQKSTTGYHSRSGAELKAILQARRLRSEEMAAAVSRAVNEELDRTAELSPNHSGSAVPVTSTPTHSVRHNDRL